MKLSISTSSVLMMYIVYMHFTCIFVQNFKQILHFLQRTMYMYT